MVGSIGVVTAAAAKNAVATPLNLDTVILVTLVVALIPVVFGLCFLIWDAWSDRF